MENAPLISGDDYNVILEDKALQEELDTGANDFAELSIEANATIEDTIDIIASTEEIEQAKESGLLSDFSVKIYKNRVNSYLDKLEDKLIITRDDRLKSGLQFDNPEAGLLSITETLKSAIRKIIEWLAKAASYYVNWLYNLIEKISQFLNSRVKISKSLREKIKRIRDNNSSVYIDTDRYKKVVEENAAAFIYAVFGKLDSSAKAEMTENGAFTISQFTVQQKLDVNKCLQIFEDIIKDKAEVKIPEIDIEKNEVVIRDNSKPINLEKALVELYGKEVLMATRSTEDQEITTKNIRVIVSKTKILFLVYNKEGTTLLNTILFKIKKKVDYEKMITIQADKDMKPSLFMDQLDYLVKLVDDASNSLRKMSKEANEKSNAVKKWSEQNAKAAQKELDDKSGKPSGIFNQAFMQKLREDAYMIWEYPSVVSSMVSALSDTVKDGITLIEASLIENPNKENISTDGTSNTGPILLLGAPKKKDEEIVDVEVM